MLATELGHTHSLLSLRGCLRNSSQLAAAFPRRLLVLQPCGSLLKKPRIPQKLLCGPREMHRPPAACCSDSRTRVLIPSTHAIKPGSEVQTGDPSKGEVKIRGSLGLLIAQYSRINELHKKTCLNQSINQSKMERHLTSTSGFPTHLHSCVCLFIHTHSTHSFPPLTCTPFK